MKKLCFLFILFFLLSCNKKEKELNKQYPEVVKIGTNQYITVDTKGNIHLISGEDEEIIIYYQEIEASLNRMFTLKDVNRSSDPDAKPQNKKEFINKR